MTLSMMQLRLASILLACVLLVMLIQSANSMQPAQRQKPNSIDEFLTAHNRLRSIIHVRPLKWSLKLAAEAGRFVRNQRDRKRCDFADLSSSKYGANQALGGLGMGPRQVVDLWASQKPFYNHANNTCAPRHECSVFTQVVWKKTVEVGCAQARCVKEGLTLTICFYFPPGNVIGEMPY